MERIRNVFLTAKAIQKDTLISFGPPAEGLRAGTQYVVLKTLTKNTRGYIEKVANQINGSYENGWYDSCAVMVRRLLETLIIETFEFYGTTDRIKTVDGDFLYLRDLIDVALRQNEWNLTRNTKRAMPRLKEIGDKSAHSRRYNAQRSDIDNLLLDIRIVVEDLLYVSKLKT